MSLAPHTSKQMRPQALTIEEVFLKLQTSSEGLSEKEAQKRLLSFGKNELLEKKSNPLILLLRQFHNLLIYILLIAATIGFLMGEVTDFFVIMAIVLINGFLGFWQEIKAEHSMMALKKLTESHPKVLRDGLFRSIPSSDLVPGDCILLHEGDIVTTDIRLFDSVGMMIDESHLTGESTPVLKDHTALLPQTAPPYDWTNMLLTGSSIVRGSGKGIVVRTGSTSYLANLTQQAAIHRPATPLMRAVKFLTRRYVGILLTFFLFLLLVGYVQKRSILELAYMLLANLVSAVPEGLPLVITLVMITGALALSKKGVLIRHLPSTETLGSATVIASDKTGTITEGKLTVNETFSFHPEQLQLVAALCNDSRDPIDLALANWTPRFKESQDLYPQKWIYPFNSKLRLMASAHDIHGKTMLLVKGSYESLERLAINREAFKEAEPLYHSFLEKGLRTIAFGMGEWKDEDPSLWKIELVGFIGFLDPPKPGVREAVLQARQAGIRTIMITGDHALTAKEIARNVGIWTEKDRLLTGEELETLSQQDLLQAIHHTTVFARILPEHKQRIVKLLQEGGDIVAVTGDGINDVPALRAADIGIAMGGGTEAAKEAANMVILDNQLHIIVQAIKNARVIADNVRKVIYYLLSTSIQELCLIALAIFFSLPLPLSAIQILWINLVTDGVQDKTFAFAREDGNVMKRAPRAPREQFFDRRQKIHISLFGLVIGCACFLLYHHLLEKYTYETASTILFTSLITAQWANGIQAQKETEPFFSRIGKSFSTNPWIFLGVGAGAILQCSALYLFPGLFHLAHLGWEHWTYPLVMFFFAFGFVEARKLLKF